MTLLSLSQCLIRFILSFSFEQYTHRQDIHSSSSCMYHFKVTNNVTHRVGPTQRSDSQKHSNNFNLTTPTKDIAAHPGPRAATSGHDTVVNDIAAWKNAMQDERRKRLQAADARSTAAAANSQRRKQTELVSGRNQGAPSIGNSSRPVEALTLQEYRSRVLNVRTTNGASSLTTSRSNSVRALDASPFARSSSVTSGLALPGYAAARATPLQKASPRQFGDASSSKRIDPCDVHYRPAHSVVRKFMQEPTPFFVRKNKYGTLDGYADQTAVALFRQNTDSAVMGASPVPIRDTKPRPEVWRQEVSGKYYDFPTPRGTMLRNAYVAEQLHLQQMQQKQQVLLQQPQQHRYQRSHSVESTINKQRLQRAPSQNRLVGAPSAAPSPRGVSALQLSADKYAVSPHHHGHIELTSRSHASHDAYRDTTHLDPVPLSSSSAPSPTGLPSSRGARPFEDPSSFHSSGQHITFYESPIHDSSSHHQTQNYTSVSSNISAFPYATTTQVGNSAPPTSSRYVSGREQNAGGDAAYMSPTQHQQRGSHQREITDTSPGVEVSPPTPAQLVAAAARGSMRELQQPANGEHIVVQPQQRALSISPMQNLLSQLALPSMRSQRSDLFQGHDVNAARGTAMMENRTESHVSATGVAHPQPNATSLRQSSVHDRLEADLNHFSEQQRERRQQQRPSGGAAVHSDPTAPSASAAPPNDSLSTSRTLLHQLASKRVPR